MSHLQQIPKPTTTKTSIKAKNDKDTHAKPQQDVANTAAHSSNLESEELLNGELSHILKPPPSGVLGHEGSAMLQQHRSFSEPSARSTPSPTARPSFPGKNFAGLPTRGVIQTKLTVGAAHDPYEEEADRVAEQVMRKPISTFAAPADEEEESEVKPSATSVTSLIQPATPFKEDATKPVIAEEAAVQSEPPLSPTSKQEEDLEPKHALAANKIEMGNGLEGHVAASRNGGHTAPRFAADFSGVQVHANAEAADQESGISKPPATRPSSKIGDHTDLPASLASATAQPPAETQPLDATLAAVNQSSSSPASQGQAESQDEVLSAQPPALEQAMAGSEVAELLPAQTAEQTISLPEDETKPAGSLTAAEGIDKEKSRLQAEEFPFQLGPSEPTVAAIQTDQQASTPVEVDRPVVPTVEPTRASFPVLTAETETSQASSATELPTEVTPALNATKPATESSPADLQNISAPASEVILPSQVMTEEDHIQRVEARHLDAALGEEDETLRASSDGQQAGSVTPDLEQRIQAMRSGGQPLPASERSFFEPRLGRDLSQVRIHADSEAADLSRQVSARAFTLGHDIAFGAGEYTPGSTEGRHLLAHELTHVVQQTGTPAAQVQRAGPSNGAPATGDQPSLLDQLKAKLEDLLNSVRSAADREASGIEGQASSEGTGVQGESQTRATGVEGEATTRGVEVEGQSTTMATGIESESITHTAATEGRSVADITKIEGEATTESTKIEGEATTETANVQSTAALAEATLSGKSDAKIESEQNSIGDLEKKGQGAIETVQGETNAHRNRLEGEANVATGELRESYTAIEAEAQGTQPDLLTQANAMMGQLQSEAQGTMEAANPTSGADLAPLEGDKAALEAKAQTMLAQLEAMLGPFFMNLVTLWEKLKQIANAIWDRLKNQVTNAWEGLKNLGNSIWQGLQNGWAGLKNMASSAWQGLTTMANTVLSGLRSLATNLWNTLTGKVGSIVSGLKATVTSAWTGLQTMAANIWTGLKSRAGTAITTVQNLASTAWNGLKNLASTAWSALQGRSASAQNGVSGRKESAISSIQGMAGEFLNKIGGILGGLKSRAGAALNGLKNVVGGALATLKNRAGAAVNNLKAQAGAAVSALKSRANTAVATFRSRAATATAMLKNKGLAAWTALKGRASAALAALKQTGSAAWTGLQNLWAGLKGRVQSTWATIQSRASALWAAFQSKISAIWASLQGVWGKIKQMGSAVWAGLQSSWDNLKNRAQLMWSAIKGGWLGIVGRAKALWGRARGTSQEGWSSITQEAQQLSTARIQLKARGNGAGQTRDPLTIQRQLGEGQSLNASARSAMESAFGENLSGVQVHTDSTAVRLARQFDARAFTVGNHIAFDTGEYRPGTLIGDALIAHEVAHTIQQRGGAADTMAKGYEPAESAVELDADHAAIGAVASKWLGAKDMLAHLPQEVALRLRTGLRLSRCGVKSGVQVNIGAIPAEIPPAIATPVNVTITLPTPTPNSTTTPAPTPTPFSGATMAVNGGGGDKGNADVQPVTLQATGAVNLTGTAVTVSAGTPLALSASLGPEKLATSAAFAVRGRLRDDLQFMIDQGTDYDSVKSRIQIAPDDQKAEALADQGFLRNLMGTLSWDDFAKSVELLGREAPTSAELQADGDVQAALNAAWTDSDVGDPANRHEEGGWIYFNLVTGDIFTRRAPSGAQAGINLNNPPEENESIVVGNFHTHPNPTAEGWVPGPSGGDINLEGSRGVPGTIRSDQGTHPYGPDHRLHLAGDRGYPGSGGGTAPQAKKDGSHDEQ